MSSSAKRKKWFRAIVWCCIIGGILCGVIVLSCNLVVKHSAKGRMYSDVQQIPYRKVGLVLGTTPFTVAGRVNWYYNYRMQAAAELYFAKKISYILVSGDNHIMTYNEPEEMCNTLVSMGVPRSVIYLDYAGFRTYDSMVRGKKVFNLDSVTVISQEWHNERALYIARHKGLDAIAYNAKDVKVRRSFIKNHAREVLSKVKVVLDILFHKKPKFLGDVILIPESHNAEYRAQLTSVAYRVEVNDTVSISEIREVMPETEDFYQIVCGLDSPVSATPRLFLLWEKYAEADSSGFLENYLRMYQWSDGYYAEGMYDVLSAAEKKHPARFDSLLALPSLKESAERYRLGMD